MNIKIIKGEIKNMKNENISIHDIVPKKIRREVYTEAIKIIESGNPIAGLTSFGLCLILPCILWDLPTFLSETPHGTGWDSYDTRNMFPELTNKRIYYIETSSSCQEERNKQRIKVLTEMLAEL
jgi:hypothetical protein